MFSTFLRLFLREESCCLWAVCCTSLRVRSLHHLRVIIPRMISPTPPHKNVRNLQRGLQNSITENSVLNQHWRFRNSVLTAFWLLFHDQLTEFSQKLLIFYSTEKSKHLMCCVYLHSIPYRWIFCFNMRASCPQTETQSNTLSSWKSSSLYELKWYTIYTNV